MDNKINNLMASFCPFGYRDMEVAIQEAEKAGKNENDVAEYVTEYMSGTGLSIEHVDVVACTFDALHQEARTDIERLTSKDICNDKPFDGVNIASNYMCTQFDGKEANMKALATLIDSIGKEARTPAINWLYEHVNTN